MDNLKHNLLTNNHLVKKVRNFSAFGAIGYFSVMTTAQAVVSENLAIDMRSMSMANAVVADAQGVTAAMHFNPAALSHVQGVETSFQGMALDFNIRNEYHPNKDFEVFTYSDDPVVCNDPETETSNLCRDFKDYGVSKTNSVSLYIPYFKKIVDLPKDVPPVVPTGAIAYHPAGSKFTYATGVYPQMVGGYNRDADDPGSFMGQKVAIERIVYASPSIAYRIDDNLSVGATVNLTYAAVALNTKLRFPNQLIGVFRFMDEQVCAQFKESGNIITDLFLLGLCNTQEGIGPFKSLGQVDIGVEDNLSTNYNLGVLWEPNDNFSWGMTYRSGAKMHLKGKYNITNSPAAQQVIRGLNSSTTGSILVALLGFPTYVPPKETGLVSAELEYPSALQTGIKYKPFSNLQINTDINWMNWSKWGSLNFKFDRPISVLRLGKLLSPNVTVSSMSLPIGFEDTWSMSFGLEYSMTDRLRFRLGYEPRKSSIPMNKRNSLLPLNNTQLFGAGIGYSFDPDTEIDLTLTHIRSRDSVPANTSNFLNDSSINNLILNPYAGLDVKTQATINLVGLGYRTKW